MQIEIGRPEEQPFLGRFPFCTTPVYLGIYKHTLPILGFIWSVAVFTVYLVLRESTEPGKGRGRRNIHGLDNNTKSSQQSFIEIEYKKTMQQRTSRSLIIASDVYPRKTCFHHSEQIQRPDSSLPVRYRQLPTTARYLSIPAQDIWLYSYVCVTSKVIFVCLQKLSHFRPPTKQPNQLHNPSLKWSKILSTSESNQLRLPTKNKWISMTTLMPSDFQPTRRKQVNYDQAYNNQSNFFSTLKSSQIRSPTLKSSQFRPPRQKSSQFSCSHQEIHDARPAYKKQVRFYHPHNQ